MNMAVEGLLPAYLQEAGYEVTPSQTTIDKDPMYSQMSDRLEGLESDRQRAISEVDAMKSDPYGRYDYTSRQSAQSRIDQIDNQINKLTQDQQGYASNWKPEVHYETRKIESPAVEQARGAYEARLNTLKAKYKGNPIGFTGAMARDAELREAKSAMESARKTDSGAKAAAAAKKEQLVSTFMDKAQKFLNGDFSITEEQRKLLDENMRPQREALSKMFEEIRSKVDDQEKLVLENEEGLMDVVNETFDSYNKQVKETGMMIGDALDLVGDQIIKTGADMETALKGVVSTNRALLKMGIEDFSGKVTKQIMGSATASGRDPTDPEYQNEIQQTVSREIERGTLNLAAMEAEGSVRIAERTGAGLEGLDYQRASLAERTGGALEGSIRDRGTAVASIRERTALERENIARERARLASEEGGANVGMEEAAANLRFQVGAGMAPQQIGLGMNVAQYQEAVDGQRMANLGNAVNMPYSMASGMRASRMQQPTTTSTQQGSILGSIFDLGVGAAGIYEGISARKYLNQAQQMRGPV